MNWRVYRCGIALAVLLGSQSCYQSHLASLLIAFGLIGPLPAVTVATTTANVLRAAFALPTACAAASAYQHQHQLPRPQHQKPPQRQRRQQQQQQQQQQQEQQLCHSPSTRYRHRRRQRRPAMAHNPDAAASSGASVAPDAFEEVAGSAAATAGAAGAAAAQPVLGTTPLREPAAGSGLEVDGLHMRRALGLARKGVGSTRPNPAVGCVILDKEGVVVGEGFHPRAGEPHAEVWALRQAGARARGGTAYVTLEPCNHFGRTPPCTTALLDCGISRVVAGMVDPDPRTAGSGLRRLADAGIDVSVGVEGAACQALNSPFVHRVSHKSCYGVLHCPLDGSSTGSESPEAVECTSAVLREADELTVPPDVLSYVEYDAIVVEGPQGVRKLAACLSALPPMTLRVVIVGGSPSGSGGGGGGGGLDAELGGVLESPLWTDSPERTIVFVPAVAVQVRHNRSGGLARAALEARGVSIVDYYPPPAVAAPPRFSPAGHEAGASISEDAAAAMAGAAATAVSRELYRRGMLCTAWEVGPVMAAVAAGRGHIQRALVRRRPRRGEIGGADTSAEGGGGVGSSGGGRDQAEVVGAAGGGVPSLEEEEKEALRVIRRLSGREGVRVRRSGRGIPSEAGARSFIEVLLPAPEVDTPAAFAS